MGCRTSKFYQKVVFRCPLNYCKGFLFIHRPRTTISRKTCFQNFKSHILKIAIFDISTLNSCQMIVFAPRNFVLVSFDRLSCLLWPPGLNSIPIDWAFYIQTYTYFRFHNSRIWNPVGGCWSFSWNTPKGDDASLISAANTYFPMFICINVPAILICRNCWINLT